MVRLQVTFRTCYVDEGELVVDPWLVAKHYAHGWLAYDVIASVPYTWLFPSVQAVRLMLLLRLVRLAKLEVVLDRVARKWDIGEIMQLWLRVITLGFYITISGHISGCAWYYIAAKIEDHSDDSWTTLYVTTPCNNAQRCRQLTVVCLVVHSSGIDDLTDMRTKYLTSVYWAFTTLTTVGYGDITAHTQWERGFSVLMLMAGAAVFAMLVGCVQWGVPRRSATGATTRGPDVGALVCMCVQKNERTVHRTKCARDRAAQAAIDAGRVPAADELA